MKGVHTSPRVGTLAPLAAFFGVSVDDLLDGDIPGRSQFATPGQVPREPSFSRAPTTVRETPTPYGDEFKQIRRAEFKLSAGASGFAIEYLNGEAPPIFFRSDWLASRGYRPDKLLAVAASGRSMEPGLYDGDLVVVDTGDIRAVDGRVVAADYDGEFTIKRLKRDGGQWWLSSDNPDKARFPDKVCTDSVRILGAVIHKQSEHL